MKTIYIGIDWSRDFIDLTALGESESILLEERIQVTRDGFKKLDEVIDHYKRKGHVVAAIEGCEHIVAFYLIDKGIPVYEANPRKVHRFKEIYSLVGQKNDRYDAKMIALYLRRNIHQLNAAREKPKDATKLVRLNYHLESLKKDRRRLTSRLRINLQSYFPGFSRIFRDITKPVLSLLLFLESPTKLRSLSLDSFLTGIQNIRWSEKRKIQIYEKLNFESPEYETSRQSECIVYTIHLIEQINLLDHQIAKMNSDIESLYNNHSGSRILSSIPAMGTMIGATLLAELSDESRGFRNYRAFQAYAGTSPVSRQSGKSQKRVVMRRACNKHLRHALYWLAFNSLTRVEWARQFYDTQRAKGKANSVTLRSLSNKWAKIIFAIWKNNSTYSADLFKKPSIHKILLT